MAGSLQAPTAGGGQDAGDEASYIITGTGTSNDGKRVRGVAPVDTATGLPGSPGGGGGGGGAVTVADGAAVTQGAKADAAVTDATIPASEMAFIKGLVSLLASGTAQVNQRRLDPRDDVAATVHGQATTATLTNVAASASTGVLLGANTAVVGVTAGRLGVIIVNDTTNPAAILRIAYAATASATAYTDLILPGDTWEMPAPIYGGIISGIWDVAAGSARITELS